MTKKKYRWIVFTILSFAIFVQYAYFTVVSISINEVDLDVLPKSIDGWTGVDDRFEGERIYELIGAEKTLLRHYTNSRNLITIYIGYYPEVREGKRPHSATGCFTGHGWNIQEEENIEIICEDGSLFEVVRLLINKGSTFQVAYVWYQNDEQSYISGFQINLSLFLRKIRFQKGDVAFIRITSNEAGSIENTDKMVQKFISDIKPYINNVLKMRGKNEN